MAAILDPTEATMAYYSLFRPSSPEPPQYFFPEPISPDSVPIPSLPGVPNCIAEPSNVYRRRTEMTSLKVRGGNKSRIGFRTMSQVEVLDDGFKWRKYGKKSVKNSPNPRNYYRCANEGCGVKKRVERDREDSRYVITIYDGVHNHLSPAAALGFDISQECASTSWSPSSNRMHMC